MTSSLLSAPEYVTSQGDEMHFSKRCIYLFRGGGCRVRARKMQRYLESGLPPRCPQQLVCKQAEARSMDSGPDHLPSGGRGPSPWTSILFLPDAVMESPSQEVELMFKPDTLI